jgi:TDG/mug DNA glycosylase family protein
VLPDYIAPNLEIIFVGLNPGEYSDRVGHYFARKQNLFWNALYAAHLVPEPLTPEDDSRLPEFGYGLTDIVKRATANVSFVDKREFVEGGRVLRAKLERLAPRLICFVGLVGYRLAFDPKAKLGVQPERWKTSHLFIVPSTSPRNAYYRDEIITWFRRLKRYHNQVKGVAQ